MKKILLILISSLCLSNDYIIDEYEFVWDIFKIGDLEISLHKNEIRTMVHIERLEFLPTEIVKLVKVLSEVDTIYKKFRNSDLVEMEEEFKVDSFIVLFEKDRDGFVVRLFEEDSWGKSIVKLSRQEVLAILPYLKQIQDMSNFLDSKINFN